MASSTQSGRYLITFSHARLRPAFSASIATGTGGFRGCAGRHRHTWFLPTLSSLNWWDGRCCGRSFGAKFFDPIFQSHET